MSKKLRRLDGEKFLCLFCKKNALVNSNHELTNDHLIPKVLGGWFTLPFVCRKCNNDYFGRDFEAKLTKSQFIAAAIDKLGLKPKSQAYASGEIRLGFEQQGGLKGYFNKDGEPGFFTQKLPDGSMLIPEEDARLVLGKQIKRWEKKTGRKCDFDIDKYEDLPYGELIVIPGTGISFIKRQLKGVTIEILGLDESIPFRLIGKVALGHLAGLYYPFAMKPEFDHLRDWILRGGANTHVLRHTPLEQMDPQQITYLPYHYIRLSFQSGGLSAIVGLFGSLKYLVYLGELAELADFPFPDILSYYHVYGIREKQAYLQNGSAELRENDDVLLNSVTMWGIYECRKK